MSRTETDLISAPVRSFSVVKECIRAVQALQGITNRGAPKAPKRRTWAPAAQDQLLARPPSATSRYAPWAPTTLPPRTQHTTRQSVCWCFLVSRLSVRQRGEWPRIPCARSSSARATSPTSRPVTADLLHGPCTRNRKIIVPTDSVLSPASQAPAQPRRLHRVAERNRVAVCSLSPTRSLFGRAVAARITRAGAAIRLRQRTD